MFSFLIQHNTLLLAYYTVTAISWSNTYTRLLRKLFLMRGQPDRTPGVLESGYGSIIRYWNNPERRSIRDLLAADVTEGEIDKTSRRLQVAESAASTTIAGLQLKQTTLHKVVEFQNVPPELLDSSHVAIDALVETGSRIDETFAMRGDRVMELQSSLTESAGRCKTLQEQLERTSEQLRALQNSAASDHGASEARRELTDLTSSLQNHLGKLPESLAAQLKDIKQAGEQRMEAVEAQIRA